MLRITNLLNQAICEKDHKAFLEELERFPEKLNQEDKRGRTPLQLASMLGNCRAMLHLLYEGVDPDSSRQLTPFYLSVDFGQVIASHILYYAGARIVQALQIAKLNNRIELQNKITNFKFDYEIFIAMLFWMISQSDENKILRLLHKMLEVIPIADISEVKQNQNTPLLEEKNKNDPITSNIKEYMGGLVEFSAQKRHFRVVELLNQNFPDMIRAETHSATCGYWAVVHENYDVIKLLNTEHDFLTLEQLQETNKYSSFDTYFNAFSAEKRRIYMQTQFPVEKLNLNIKKIYSAAKYNKTELIESYRATIIDPLDFLEAISFAYHKRNYVALFCLLDAKYNFDLFPLLLKDRNRDLLLTNLFINDFSKSSEPRDIILAREIIEHTHDGLINENIYLGLNGFADSRTEQEVGLQKKYFKELNVSLDDWINKYFKIMYQRDDIHSKNDIEEKIVSAQWPSLVEHAKRFQFKIALEDKKRDSCTSVVNKIFNTPGMIGSIRSFLTISEQAKLNTVSHLFLEKISQSLSDEINGFLLVLNTEIANKNSTHNRGTFLGAGLMIAIFVGLLCFCIRKTSEARALQNTIFDNLYSSNTTDGTSCANALPYGRDSSGCNGDIASLPPCSTYCDELGNSLLFGLRLADTFEPPIGVALTLVYIISRGFRNDDAPLRSYPHLHDRAQRLFFKVNNHLENKLNLDSSVKTVKESLTEHVTTLSIFKPKESEEEKNDVNIDIVDNSVNALD